MVRAGILSTTSSLTLQGWTEENIKQYDEFALEDHSCEATPAERARYEKNLKISLNRQGREGPIRQRHDFGLAKHAYRQLYKEHAESTGEGNKPIHPAQQRRQNYKQQFAGFEKFAYTVHPRTGWNILSFHKFVIVLTLATKRSMEDELKLDKLAKLNLE